MKEAEARQVLLPDEVLFGKMFHLRGERVMLDQDLAELYHVPTKALNQAVRRNQERFPPDFMFQISEEEMESIAEMRKRQNEATARMDGAGSDLRSQIVTSSWGGRRYLPLAFTEQGVAMLSSVLKSERAVSVNIQIMRLFVKLRRLIVSYEELSERLSSLEMNQAEHAQHLRQLFHAMQNLLEPRTEKRERVGFRTGK